MNKIYNNFEIKESTFHVKYPIEYDNGNISIYSFSGCQDRRGERMELFNGETHQSSGIMRENPAILFVVNTR